jgi:predicted NAD/FAD-dependent oxidoreductase
MEAGKIAVIGAGLAGLACARRLVDAGRAVTVFDKGRAAGGRMSTRRAGLAAWDHGAQYFTVRDPGFERLVGRARAAGQLQTWHPRWPGGEQEDRSLWVGVPGLSAFPRWLAGGLDVASGTQVLSLSRQPSGWTLTDQAGRHVGGFDLVVLAMPAPQAAALADGHTALSGAVAAIRMDPCWAVMAAFERPVEAGCDADWSPDPVLPWLARNNSKPGRTGPEAWVLHADAGWSREHLEDDVDAVQAALLGRLAERLSVVLPPVMTIEARRWRHARVVEPLGEAWLLDRGAGIAFCGDWCLDARVEAAFLSGDRLGAELAGS